jgi:hypothetical protein
MDLSHDLIEEISEYCKNSELKNLVLVSRKYYNIARNNLIYKINPRKINDNIYGKLKLNLKFFGFTNINKKYYDRICVLDLSFSNLFNMPKEIISKVSMLLKRFALSAFMANFK